MLTAHSSLGFDPAIANLRFVSLYEANYTVSNIQIGSANLFFGVPGDFDRNGIVDGHDFLSWQQGESPDPFSADDLADWGANYGMVAALSANSTAVPEPTSLVLLSLGGFLALSRFRRATAVTA
jgi:hypothetical protein